MKTSKGLVAAITTIVVCAVAFLAFVYNISISATLTAASQNDREILTDRNNDIIELFEASDSTAQWQKIVDRYRNIIIRVEDTYGRPVAKTVGKSWSRLDVTVRTDFKYNNVSYRIRSSVAFDRSYLTDTSYIVRLYCTAAIALILTLAIFGSSIYIIMLRPYHKIYRSIENFDSEAVALRSHSKSYSAKVYNRLCDLKENVQHERENQRRIIASISHDIKTPLTSIMGYAEQLRKENLSPERKTRYINTVYNKSVEIRDLVNDFDEYLGYSLERSFFTEANTTEQICELLQNNYRDELEREGVKFIVQNKAPGRQVKFDKQKMLRVIGNLITNSLKHFSDHEKIMEIEILPDGKYVTTRFSDSGTGVDNDKLELIFEPLYTSDEGRKVAGLGLAICKEIVEAHNGKIWAEKSHLGGLCICIAMPEVR